MEYEGNPYRDPAFPAPPPDAPRARWKMPRAAVTVGLAALLGMAGAGVAFAVTGPGGTTSSFGALASSTSSTTAPANPNVPPMGRHAMGGWGPGGGHEGMGRGVVHGIYTVKNGSGYLTEEVQVGLVQPGNTDTSITVKSDDGYPQTYAVQPSTVVNSQAGGISTIKSGDRVRVQAIEKNGGYTATDIVDLNQISSSRHGFGFAPPGPPPSTGSGTAPTA